MSDATQIDVSAIYSMLGELKGLLVSMTEKTTRHEQEISSLENRMKEVEAFIRSTEKVAESKDKHADKMFKMVGSFCAFFSLLIAVIGYFGYKTYDKTSIIDQKTDVAMQQSYKADRIADSALYDVKHSKE